MEFVRDENYKADGGYYGHLVHAVAYRVPGTNTVVHVMPNNLMIYTGGDPIVVDGRVIGKTTEHAAMFKPDGTKEFGIAAPEVITVLHDFLFEDRTLDFQEAKYWVDNRELRFAKDRLDAASEDLQDVKLALDRARKHHSQLNADVSMLRSILQNAKRI